MTKEILLKIYEENTECINDMIISLTMFADEIDENVCKSLEKGLRILAENGNKQAAAMYGMATAYRGFENFFSEITASQLIFKLNAIDEYHKLLKSTIVDNSSFPDDENSYFLNAPSIWLAKALIESEKIEKK